jgi:hypothetical protein
MVTLFDRQEDVPSSFRQQRSISLVHQSVVVILYVAVATTADDEHVATTISMSRRHTHQPLRHVTVRLLLFVHAC